MLGLRDYFNKINYILTKQGKKEFIVLVFFSIFISIIETVGVSAILPFIKIAINSSIIFTNDYSNFIYNYFNFDSELYFIIFFGIFLILYYIFRCLISIYYTYQVFKFSTNKYHIIAYRLFENYMRMSYVNFTKKNSSDLSKNIINETTNVTTLLSSLLTLISESLVFIFLYTIMIYVDYKITLFLTLFLMINIALIIYFVSRNIKKKGAKKVKIQQAYHEIINKSLSNFKIIKLYGKDEDHLNEFKIISKHFSRINMIAHTLIQIPRFILETLGFILVIFIILYLIVIYGYDKASVLSTLSLFVVALYRLMPSLSRILAGYNMIVFTSKSLDIIHSDLLYNAESLGSEEVFFDNSITLHNVSFDYGHHNVILNKIHLHIYKGSRIAFIGESGSGKSTLINLIMGLYKPSCGRIIVDNRELTDSNVKSWRNKFGYIPQSVYLFDGSVAQNVAMSDKYDSLKVIESLKKAKIYDFLLSQKGILTQVGEGGILLSGGQKQRIAIARAIYSDPEVLILDEATSALDNEIEAQIMNEIYTIASGKTLIIVAHRLSTIKQCDTVFKLEKGVITCE